MNLHDLITSDGRHFGFSTFEILLNFESFGCKSFQNIIWYAETTK